MLRCVTALRLPPSEPSAKKGRTKGASFSAARNQWAKDAGSSPGLTIKEQPKSGRGRKETDVRLELSYRKSVRLRHDLPCVIHYHPSVSHRADCMERMQYAADAGDDDDEACCNCGLKAARLTVSKEGAFMPPEHHRIPSHLIDFTSTGPNQGRAFYKCSKVSKTSQCDYFSWADGPDDGARNGSGGGNYRDRANAGGGGGGGPAPSGDCFNCGECTWMKSSLCASRSCGTDADDALVQLVIGRRIAHKAVPEARTPEAAVPTLQEKEVVPAAAAVPRRREIASTAASVRRQSRLFASLALVSSY